MTQPNRLMSFAEALARMGLDQPKSWGEWGERWLLLAALARQRIS